MNSWSTYHFVPILLNTDCSLNSNVTLSRAVRPDAAEKAHVRDLGFKYAHERLPNDRVNVSLYLARMQLTGRCGP